MNIQFAKNKLGDKKNVKFEFLGNIENKKIIFHQKGKFNWRNFIRKYRKFWKLKGKTKYLMENEWNKSNSSNN